MEDSYCKVAPLILGVIRKHPGQSAEVIQGVFRHMITLDNIVACIDVLKTTEWVLEINGKYYGVMDDGTSVFKVAGPGGPDEDIPMGDGGPTT